MTSRCVHGNAGKEFCWDFGGVAAECAKVVTMDHTSCESKIKKLEEALCGSIADTVAEAAWRATLAETRADDTTHHGRENDPPNECTLYYIIHEAIWTALDEALNEGKE